MTQLPEDNDPLVHRFDQWLQQLPLTARPNFLKQVRGKIKANDRNPDAVIDSLLKQDPALHNPRMIAQVRARLNKTKESRGSINWFQWLTPLAAAAMLTLAFMSFQIRAPQQIQAVAIDQLMAPVNPARAYPDADLTQIFALATNLHGSTDVSSLQSVDNLAFLFE